MSHIDGHVDQPPGSCGVLKMAKSEVKLYFAPHLIQNWELRRRAHIGFHPFSMRGLGADSVLAMNVYKFDDYQAVEDIIMAEFPGKRLEQLYKDTLAHAKIRSIAACFSPIQKEIVEKTLEYFKTPDFKKFYVEGHPTWLNIAPEGPSTAKAMNEIARIMKSLKGAKKRLAAKKPKK